VSLFTIGDPSAVDLDASQIIEEFRMPLEE
jgi:hypothetical protein